MKRINFDGKVSEEWHTSQRNLFSAVLAALSDEYAAWPCVLSISWPLTLIHSMNRGISAIEYYI